MQRKLSLTWLIFIQIALLSRRETQAANSCVNMWDADPNDQSLTICDVQTESGLKCAFPFFNDATNKQHSTCIIINSYPQCITTANAWSKCNVPNDAIVTQVTTRKAGPWWVNGASLNGGTMVWISGLRFAPNLFSTSPTTTTSNQVYLVSSFASYNCEIHPDKTTTTQITCYTSAMPAGIYFVKVAVYGQFIPVYQYMSTDQAVVTVSASNTPQITSLAPTKGLPGTFVAVNGDFKTICYARDDTTNDNGVNCGDDSMPRISRIFLGGQNCELFDSLSNQMFANLTQNKLECKANKPEVSYFNASMLVSNEFGRSLVSSSSFYVSPDDSLYNFQTYAAVDSVSPQTGSTAGGHLTLAGKYFYTDINVPARIEVGGQPCSILSFDMTNLTRTQFVCQNVPQPAASTEYYGNRGITLYRDNVYSASLASAQPSGSAQMSVLNQASYADTQTTDVTVWLKGFFNPKKSSKYEFSLVTNGQAILYVSTDSTSANKALVASTPSQLKGTVSLEANKNYYFEVVATKQSGGLNLNVNGKLLETSLTDKISAYVFNELQDIEISSTVVSQSYRISYSNFVKPTGQSEVQNILIETLGTDVPFVLRFNGVSTTNLLSGASAQDVQNALNDLPNLSPGLVQVTQSAANSYSVQFSASLGDVDLIEEVLRNVNATITEQVKGSPSGDAFQLNIENKTTGLFSLNDTSANIQKVISDTFGIKCPVSVLNSSDVFRLNDHETCNWDSSSLSATVFCGKCSRKNSNNLFWNWNSTLAFKFVCYAYRLTKPFNQLNYHLIDPLTGGLNTFTVNVQTIADNNWHYNCTDMTVALRGTTYASNAANLRVFQAWVSPAVNDIYLDAVTVRRTPTLGYNDGLIASSRRLFPNLQILPNTLSVSKTSSALTITYRPANCSYNLQLISFSQNFTDLNVTEVSAASPPVTGSFQLNWNNFTLDVPANSTDSGLTAMLQSIQGFGFAEVTRTKDCSGHKWSTKWLSGGDKAPFIISSNTLTGNSPTISATTRQDGGALFTPITDDLLRTYHTVPQVTVSINNINSICTSSCNFEWSSSATPVVTSINTSPKSSITIAGSGFDTTLQNNIVLIGNVSCTILTATSTQLTCSAGQNPIGTYNFTISVVNKGLAVMNSNPSITFSLNAVSVNPTSSGTGGGSMLTVNGEGFNSRCQVTVDGNDCPVISANYSVITCVVPSNPTLSDKIVDVVVLQDSVSSSLSQVFTYDATNTPYVTGIVPNILSVLGGEIVTITGTNLPISPGSVTIGKQRATIVNSTSSNLVLKSPALAPGLYDIIIPVASLGNVNFNKSKVEYKLYVSSITPSAGSIRGGAVVTVYGDGFSSNCSLNQVAFGKQACNVISCTNNWIQCQTSSAYIVHQVDNSAADPYYGKGYAWSQPYLTISKGDTVNWSWKPPVGISGVSFQVAQVADSTSIFTSGFSSGTPTPVGSFSYQFNQPGIYHYWSGYVENSQQITFRGVINVVDSFDKELEVNVQLNGFSAQKCSFPFTYNSNSYSSCTQTDFNFNWCSPSSTFTGQILKCDSISQPTAGACDGASLNLNTYSLTQPASVYKVLFTTGNSQLPTITSMTSDNITLNSEITIEGTGFSTTQCENQVFVNGINCPIKTSSSSQLVCQFDSNTSLQPNVAYSIEVLVKNIGYALQNRTYLLRFLPSVTSVSQNVGSLMGGARLILLGKGFIASNTLVQIGQNYYYNNDPRGTQVKYDSITLKTLQELEGAYDIKVTSNGVTSVCSAANCSFEYSQAMTPTITNVSPSTISSSGTITINGTSFGTNSSSVSVKIGSQICTPNSVNDASITCQLDGLNLGNQVVSVNVNEIGDAKNDQILYVTGSAAISAISPLTGSVYGGTVLTLTGNGFDSTTRVLLHTVECKINSVAVNSLTCVTGAHAANTVNFNVSNKNGTVNFATSLTYSYDASVSPVISSVSPTSGSSGTLTLAGSGFGTDSSKVTVKVGSQVCSVQTTTDSQITCNLSAGSAGVYPVVVNLTPSGNSNNDKTFTFDLTISSLSQTQGSIGGSLSLAINGLGFSSNSQVTICNNNCTVTASSVSSITCQVPQASTKNADSTCTLTVRENGQTATSTFDYLLSLTPTLTSASPLRGGTGGGTLITITGTNFPADPTQISVKIAGSVCDITSATTTQIQCRTNSYAGSSIKAPINVFIQNSGLALNNGTVMFEYIDLWSSKWTWGGLEPPGEGELAVIGPTQTIYFDAATTPVLKGIIIQGGSLIFDDNQDVSLNVEYIIITDGGRFQVGTRDAPFLHNAVITMYGSVRSVELPMFGSKVLGLRNGTIDMHGKPVGVTWTHLGATAAAGASSITLKEPVDWPVGAQIVIASTGDKFSIGQSEVRRITAKSADKATLTLDSALNHEHLGTTRTVGTGSRAVEIILRAEVGLLSRNLVFKGSIDPSWAPLLSAPACPNGFDPEEFAVQTCFLGRYGPELGTDQFGAIILINGKRREANEPESVIGRFSNVELFHVGQAFRLGRYPIHFHMNGDMPSSYVRECAIHQSFNRATNIHASNYVTIERNVIYNIMGGAYFLEDGIEIGNRFLYNLAVFVRTSSSLLNEDITPAAFWATNPNNTYLHNAVAGSTHFGWWYRLLNNPDGPSFTTSYCPRKIPFGMFFNNSVHSTGRFGLWIFPMYAPTISGACSDSRPSVAVFNNFVSWSNDKGAEFVEAASVQFRNFTIWDHYSEGIATKTMVGYQAPNSLYANTFYNENTGTVVADSIIIGNSLGGTQSYTIDGIVVPWDRGQLVKNVSFYNFPAASSRAMRCPIIAGRCTVGCGGWGLHTRQLYFENVRFRTLHRWNWDLVFHDLDGTLTGNAGDVVVAKDNITLTNPSCRDTGQNENGVACSNTKSWIRFSYNNYQPQFALLLNITNRANQTTSCRQLKKRLTHPQGLMMALESNQSYTFVYDEATRPTNISYDGTFYGFKPNDYLIIRQPLAGRPDKVKFDGLNDNPQSYYPLTESNKHGDWYWDNDTYSLHYMIKNDKNRQPIIDYPLKLSVFKCRYVGCEPPVNPAYKLPVTQRPADALFWSNLSTWSMSQPGWGGSQFGLPKDGDSVLIPDGKYVVVDCPLPKLKNLQIEGILEFDNGRDHRLEVEMIFVNGGQLIVGWPNDPILTNVEIILTGAKNAMNFKLPDGLSLIGGKGIGVYGGLDIHGRPRNISWTKLSQTMQAGSNQISLVEAVDWIAGDEILIATSSYIVSQNEIFKIVSVSSDMKTLTLNQSAKFSHVGMGETFSNGVKYQIGAAVGLLTRNVKIIGGEYPNHEADLFGFRVIVSTYSALVNGLETFYKGYARITNAQFIRPGQFSLDANDDSKYGILFSDLGEYNSSRPSYVRSSSFQQGYSCAIGIFKSNRIPIENNLIYRSITFGLNIRGNSNIMRKNLIVETRWVGSILPWTADLDIKYLGAVNLDEADTYVLEDNYIAGADRIGILYRGDLCQGEKIINGWNNSVKGNTVVAALAGIAIFPSLPLIADNYLLELDCVRISGFTIFKSSHWGIYYQGKGSVMIDSNIVADNQINIFTFVIKPSSVAHEVGGKVATIQNNLIIGQSPTFNCSTDVKPSDQNFLKASTIQSFGSGSSESGKIGIVWSNFLDGSNKAPGKPWAGIKTYNQISGLMLVNNVTFAYFDKNCDGSYDSAIAGSLKNDDGQHPVKVQNIKFYNVNNASKVWLFRPNLNKINPSDCVDMDCDGHKKNLLTDLDGSFLGSPGDLISQSEFEWGSQQRGLGDFRIPKEALAAPNGSMLSISQVYTYLGIVRDENLCSFKPDWQAYECHGLVYKMLIIESMDNDTEARRISPVAIISDNKYLDLINGPQDHGWCAGYTCQRRVSTFIALVVANRSYDVYLTSTPPNQLRFRILDADSNFKIRLSMYYFTAQRIDLYLNDTFIAPTNADYTTGKMQIKDPGSNQTAFMPTHQSPIGTNFFSKPDRRMYFAIDGTSYVDLKIAPVLFVRFGVPAITADQFFNTQTLVGNMALLLGIDSSKIRRAEIVRATSKKRQANSLAYIVLTIFEDAPTSLNDTQATNTQKQAMNQLDAKITNMFMTGQLQEQAKSLNITLTSMSVQRPNSNTTDQPVVKIAKLVVAKEASSCAAQTPCLGQPSIMVADDNGNLVSNIGNPLYPWIVQATINSSTNANLSLLFQTEVPVVNGFANFTKLGVSDITDKLVISYSFKLPAGINESSFDPMNRLAGPIQTTKPRLTCLNFNNLDPINENDNFNLTVSIVDRTTRIQMPNINWNNYSWVARISMYPLGYYPARGSLNTANTQAIFDTATGLAQFTNLKIDLAGMYVIRIQVNTLDNDYNLQCLSNPIQIKKSTTLISYDSSLQPDYMLKFNGDYNSIEPSDIKANVYNYFANNNITVGGISSYSGSVIVVFYSSDSNPVVISSLASSGLTISPNLTFASITVGSTTYTCTNCTVVVINTNTNSNNSNSGNTNSNTNSNSNTINKSDASSQASNQTGAIVGGVIGGAALVAFIIFGIIGYSEFQKIKLKTRSVRPVSVAWSESSQKKAPVFVRVNSQNDGPPPYIEDLVNKNSLESI